MTTKTVGRPKIEISDKLIIESVKKYGSLRKTAEALGLSFSTLQRRFNELGIKMETKVILFYNGKEI